VIPLSQIRPYVVDVVNNGLLSDRGDYWATEEDVERLFKEVIPQRTATWQRRRVMLFLHGGLNDERATAKRVLAMRDVLLANEIYPLHLMWESGAMETIRGLIEDVFKPDERAGVAEWLRRTRKALIDAKDWSLELTAAGPGGALWRAMKENARLSSERKDRKARSSSWPGTSKPPSARRRPMRSPSGRYTLWPTAPAASTPPMPCRICCPPACRCGRCTSWRPP
jgi:hypothetical protein